MNLKVSMQHRVLEYFQICSNDDPELTLTYFTARSNLIPYAFVWEKGKIMDFSETMNYNKLCSNDYPELTLTYFTARSNLVPYAFVWEKGKTMDFSETIVVYDIKVGRFSLLNEYVNHYVLWISKVKVIHWTSSKVTQIQHFQSSFAQKLLGRLKPNFIWSLHEMWGMKIFSNVPGHMTMPI